jgi:hypothetical protein
VLQLSEIWIYPIKSMGGIRLQSSKVAEKGLILDRRWMLIDESNTFITQRVHPILALFKLEKQEDAFRITFKEDSILLPISKTPTGLPLKTMIWDDEVITQEVSLTSSKWFSEKLDMPCKLVAFPENNSRPVDPNYAIHQEQVSLADGYPLLIIGQNSLNDLNSKLSSPLPMNRFRPNLVFTGGLPYEEDSWKYFSVGKNKFAGVKPCSRCVLTTVDQETGKQGKEPLATLATYRKTENKIYFGQNVLAINYHEIHEGDEIILE